MALALLVLIVALLLSLVAGDCPPRTREPWERGTGVAVLASYDKDAPRCPNVAMAMYPYRVTLDPDLASASLKVSILMEWQDPGLVLPGEPVGHPRLVNTSTIWIPKLMSSVMDEAILEPDSAPSSFAELYVETGSVRYLFRTTMRGLCYSGDAWAWPRDTLHCHFWIIPSAADMFNLTQSLSIKETVEQIKKYNLQPYMERMSAWGLTLLDSELFELADHSTVLIQAALQRLPGQLEAVVVHPGCAVLALAPVSAALPPACSGRAAMVAVAVLLHGLHMLSLPEHLANVEPGSIPRNVLLFRDAALLILIVALQWLVSLHLASRRRPLPTLLLAAGRFLAVLRTPLLLPAVPAVPAMPAAPASAAPSPRQVPDEESVGLSEVLDRLTLLATAATYLAVVVVSL